MNKTQAFDSPQPALMNLGGTQTAEKTTGNTTAAPAKPTRLDPVRVTTDISHSFTLVHPDDREAAIAHNIAGNAAGVRYFWKGRWLQDDEVCWVTIESNPRRLSPRRGLMKRKPRRSNGTNSRES